MVTGLTAEAWKTLVRPPLLHFFAEKILQQYKTKCTLHLPLSCTVRGITGLHMAELRQEINRSGAFDASAVGNATSYFSPPYHTIDDTEVVI